MKKRKIVLFVILILILLITLLISCGKEDVKPSSDEIESNKNNTATSEQNESQSNNGQTGDNSTYTADEKNGTSNTSSNTGNGEKTSDTNNPENQNNSSDTGNGITNGEDNSTDSTEEELPEKELPEEEIYYEYYKDYNLYELKPEAEKLDEKQVPNLKAYFKLEKLKADDQLYRIHKCEIGKESGTYKVVTIYNNQGRMIKKEKYDQQGDLTEEILYNSKEQISRKNAYMNSELINYAIMNYDADDNLASYQTYTADGKKVAEVKLTYNEYGLLKKSEFYENGQLIKYNVYTYNIFDELTKIEIFDSEGNVIGVKDYSEKEASEEETSDEN